MIFKPLSSKQVFEEISDQIKEGIQYGLLQPGDKLPPERELRANPAIARRDLKVAKNIENAYF